MTKEADSGSLPVGPTDNSSCESNPGAGSHASVSEQDLDTSTQANPISGEKQTTGAVFAKLLEEHPEAKLWD